MASKRHGPDTPVSPGNSGKPKPGLTAAQIIAAIGKTAGPPAATKTLNADQIAIGMFKKFAPNYIKTGYWQTALSYAHLYGVPAPYLASLLIAENNRADPKLGNQAGSSAMGLAQILDPVLYDYNKGRTLTWGQGHTLATGSTITTEMKQNPVFAIAYAAWRIAGESETYGSFKTAYMQHYSDGKIDPQKFYGSYVPSKADYKVSKLTTNVSNQPTNNASDPFVTYDSKTGKVGSTIDPSDKTIVEFQGFPMTASHMRQQLQDKNGLGGDVYSLTGQTPTIPLLAGLMSAKDKHGFPLTVQQIENALIDSKFFMKSPTGKKYSLSYQGVYQNIMGADAKLPAGTSVKDPKTGKTVLQGSWAQLVKNAAKNNLTADEFATQIRSSPGYLDSNEYKQAKTSFSDSYEHIYGPMDENAKRLASDAALSGWNRDQWEHYLRSQPNYTKTPEYKSHALSILDSLGLSFGFLPSLKEGEGQTPTPGALGSPDASPNQDKRVTAPSGAPSPQDATQGLGVNY